MTIWFDHTTTLRNRGRNGIANVEWSIGAALRTRPDVRDCALDSAGRLVEIDPAVDLERAVYASAGSTGLDASSPIIGVRGGVRSVLIEALETSAPWAIAPAQRIAAQPARVGRRVRASVPRRGRPDALRRLVRHDDVVISLGADWEGGLAAELAGLRAATRCSVVTMVYDLVPLTHPHLAFHNDAALFTRYYEGLLRCSDLIMCISEQSRRDLLEFAADRSIEPPDTRVARLGERPPIDTEPVERDDFFLWVGTVERRKNLGLLYDALRLVERRGEAPPTVVVAGAPGWGVDDLLLELDRASSAASRALVRLGAVDEPTLDSLYRRARALLFPSHFEGWGMPVREAAVRGCPVAAGDSPAVREAAEGIASVRLLPTTDPEPWAEYLLDPDPPARAVAARPWSEVADDVLELIDDTCGYTEEMTDGNR